ncbi:hypothetical protein ACWGHM_14625 [Streptomyces sp. NPDC054904]
MAASPGAENRDRRARGPAHALPARAGLLTSYDKHGHDDEDAVDAVNAVNKALAEISAVLDKAQQAMRD